MRYALEIAATPCFPELTHSLGPNNKVEYNFPWIGDCTKNRKFNGPCTQPSAPVPCADGTCKSTFVECARALKALEEQRENTLKEAKRRVEAGEVRASVSIIR